MPADGMNTDIHGSAEYRAHLVGVHGPPGAGRGIAFWLPTAYLWRMHCDDGDARPCAGHPRFEDA